MENEIVETFESKRDKAIMAWSTAQSQLAYWKELESQKRIEALTLCFETPPDSGTVNYDLGKGFVLKAVFKENYKLNEKGLDAALDKIEKLGEAGELIVNRVIRWKPELSKTEYEAMPPNMRKILDEVITISPGTPSLSLVTPKVPK